MEKIPDKPCKTTAGDGHAQDQKQGMRLEISVDALRYGDHRIMTEKVAVSCQCQGEGNVVEEPVRRADTPPF